MANKTRYAKVAVPIHSDKTFTYLIPESLKTTVSIGSEVLVDFGRRKVSGFVVGFDDNPVEGMKEIRKLLSEKPLFSPAMLRLTRWMADYYMCSWGEALKAAIPAGAQVAERKYVRALKAPSAEFSKQEREVLEALAGKEKASVRHLSKTLPKIDVPSILKRLESANAVTLSSSIPESSLEPEMENLVTLTNMDEASTHAERLRKRSPKQAEILAYLASHKGSATWSELRSALAVPLSSLNSLEKDNLIKKSSIARTTDPTSGMGMQEPPPPEPTHHQAHALALVKNYIERKTYRTMLLYGVTGSGKTEVYMRAAAMVLKLGRQVIMLVPEISLTPQTASRFLARFGKRVAIIHSKLSQKERGEVWRRISEGEFELVIGPRSAVFAPTPNLGLIVVDEEHEASYKQTDMSPRYNARDAAVMRAKMEGCLCMLGSATPSLESYQNAVSRRYDLVVLPVRIDDRPLPGVTIVDMKAEEDPVFSSLLREKITDRMKKNEQVILFLNRRGFSKFILCRDCGHVDRCPSCSVSLTYHRDKGILLCHYCGYKKNAPDICPECKSSRLLTRGLGTERVEKELDKVFPGIRVLRMDSDTTTAKHSHRDIFQAFRNLEADVLLGTQMIAKGFDFPKVTLVGVISADTSLNIPDLRSAERTFQLLTQVAGRTGRSGLGGEVIIQTFSPEVDVVRAAASQGYKDFFEVESEERGELDYPPFSRMINITVRSTDESLAQTTARRLKGAIERRIKSNEDGIAVLGPAPAPIFRLRGDYRYRILLKAKGPLLAQKVLKPILADWSTPRKVRLSVDIDPVDSF